MSEGMCGERRVEVRRKSNSEREERKTKKSRVGTNRATITQEPGPFLGAYKSYTCLRPPVHAFPLSVCVTPLPSYIDAVTKQTKNSLNQTESGNLVFTVEIAPWQCEAKRLDRTKARFISRSWFMVHEDEDEEYNREQLKKVLPLFS